MRQTLDRYDLTEWRRKVSHEMGLMARNIAHAYLVEYPERIRWTVDEYIREEVRRQGHDLSDPQDGGIRVIWMQDAWQTATQEAAQGKIPTVEVIEELGRILEPQKNERGFRTCGVRVGSRICPPWETVRPALKELVASIERNGRKLDPLEWYKQFELLHPFVDANGRAGKIILAWMAGTLDHPFFPPNDLFGDWIANP